MDEQRRGKRKIEPASRIRAVPDPRMSRSLEYGLAMLECFSTESPALGIAELAQAVGISRSTTHRYAMTLVMLGYLEQDRKRKYRLASRAFEPGIAAIGTMRLLAPARTVLEDLRDWTGHTVGMGTLDGTRAVYLHRLHGHRPGQYEADLDLGVGASVPLHCTALGKALMASLPARKRAALLTELELTSHGPNSITAKRRLAAELDSVAERGLALSDEELAPGLRSIAAAVKGTGAGTIAIDVTAPSSACTARQLLETAGPMLERAAQRISAAAGAVEESAAG